MTNNQNDKKMVFVRPKKVMALHGFNAFCWFLLTFTGLAIIRGDYRFMPNGFAEWVQNLVGGQFYLINGHSILGLIWAFVMFAFTVVNFKDVVIPFLKNVISITPKSIIEDGTYIYP